MTWEKTTINWIYKTRNCR